MEDPAMKDQEWAKKRVRALLAKLKRLLREGTVL